MHAPYCYVSSLMLQHTIIIDYSLHHSIVNCKGVAYQYLALRVFLQEEKTRLPGFWICRAGRRSGCRAWRGSARLLPGFYALSMCDELTNLCSWHSWRGGRGAISAGLPFSG